MTYDGCEDYLPGHLGERVTRVAHVPTVLALPSIPPGFLALFPPDLIQQFEKPAGQHSYFLSGQGRGGAWGNFLAGESVMQTKEMARNGTEKPQVAKVRVNKHPLGTPEVRRPGCGPSPKPGPLSPDTEPRLPSSLNPFPDTGVYHQHTF